MFGVGLDDSPFGLSLAKQQSAVGRCLGSPFPDLASAQFVSSAALLLPNPYSEEVFQRRRYVKRPWKEHWRPAKGGDAWVW